MSQTVIILIAISEIVSLILLIKLWQSGTHNLFKVTLSIILLLPFIGPPLYLFINDAPPVQPDHLKNNMGRGRYTDRWISMSPLWKKWAKEKQDKINNDADSNPRDNKNT